MTKATACWLCHKFGHKFYRGVAGPVAITGPWEYAMLRECQRCGEIVGYV